MSNKSYQTQQASFNNRLHPDCRAFKDLNRPPRIAAQCINETFSTDVCCSNCTVQKQTTSFLHHLSDRYLNKYTTNNNIDDDDDTPYKFTSNLKKYETSIISNSSEPNSVSMSEYLTLHTKLSLTTSSTHNFYIRKLSQAIALQHRSLTTHIQDYKESHPAHQIDGAARKKMINIRINDTKNDKAYSFKMPRDSNINDIKHYLITKATDIHYGEPMDLSFLPFAPFDIELIPNPSQPTTNCNIDDPLRFPIEQALLPHWVAYDLVQQDVSIPETVKYELWDGSSSQQDHITFQQCIANKPLEFDIDWRNAERFQASIAYDILIKPLLSKKRTLRQIFFERKIYREEDDDGYDPIKHNKFKKDGSNTLYNITKFNNNELVPQSLSLLQSSPSTTTTTTTGEQQQQQRVSLCPDWGEVITSNTLQHFTNYTQHVAQIDQMKVFLLQSILVGYQLISNTLKAVSPIDYMNLQKRPQQPKSHPHRLGSFQLELKHPEGQRFIIDALETDTIDYILDHIAPLLQKTSESQCIIYNDIELNRERTLGSYNIRNNTKVCIDTRTQNTLPAPRPGCFKLELETFSGDCVTIDAVSDDTVEWILDRVAPAIRTFSETQSIIYNGEELSRQRTLESYGICGPTKALISLRPGYITIFFKLIFGKILAIDASEDDTIQTIKKRVETLEGYPPKAQHMVLGPEELEDNSTLRSRRIGHGTHIYLVVAIRGR